MPDLTLYLRVVENDVENDYDGGRLLAKPVKGGCPADLIDASFVVSARTDAFLRQFPSTREAMQGRFYRLDLTEVAASELPPDPDAEARIQQLESELAALKGGG